MVVLSSTIAIVAITQALPKWNRLIPLQGAPGDRRYGSPPTSSTGSSIVVQGARLLAAHQFGVHFLE